tara:strand:+ start:315 stop:506 length:192 start_codon:yes stop_codon:yes gene_type:complete
VNLTKEQSEKKLKIAKKIDVYSIKIDIDLNTNQKKKLLYDFNFQVKKHIAKKTMILMMIPENL